MRQLKTSLRGWVFAAVSTSLPLSVAADEMDAAMLLSTMSTAMQTLNYEGTFVHIQNGHADLMHILHANDENGESERMRSLNGEAREVIRNNSLVTCIWPGSNDVIVNKSKPRTLIKPVDSALTDSDMYLITTQGKDRVAGLAANVVSVVPKDDYRYGYRFWVDTDTGMMLRSMVLDARQNPVEELMFTSITYLDSVDPQRFVIDPNEPQAQWTENAENEENSIRRVVDKVRFDALPNGFEERSETLRMMAVRKDSPVSHVVVSDGIATVSVYVEYVARAQHDPSALGSTHMGAINAYGLSLPTALVTVVGEAPGKAVESIARATRLVN